jgi:hypothetical protein
MLIYYTTKPFGGDIMDLYTKNGRNCMQPFSQMIQGNQAPFNYMMPGSQSQNFPFTNQLTQDGLPLLPTGIPAGPSATSPVGGATVYGQPAPATIDSVQYTAGFLKTQIGRKVRVEFLIGTNGPLVDRTGTLKYVGISYILLQPIDSDDLLMCDLYSIKFVTVIL